MASFWDSIANSNMLAPHGYCLLWRPELLWTHVVADALIGSAYMSIPFALALFVRKRKDVAFGWVFWCFVTFILACGLTHYFSIWTLWHADYGWEALLKAFTALVSVATAAVLWPLVPQALRLPSNEQMRLVNEELRSRVEERDRAIEALESETRERVRAEAALLQSRKMEALGQLTGGIAHDFNNLLTVIRGASEMLQRPEITEERRTLYLRGIEDASGKAARLTGQLLAFARKQPVKTEVVDVNRALDAISDMLGRSLGEHIAVTLNLDPAIGRVRIDPTQFEMAILNLAVNARDAMPGGGTLRIATERVSEDGAQWVATTVTDTGTGMPPEVMERAFDPFFTTKAVGGGTALGLSQVYGFAGQCGGVAQIRSVVDEGTTISIRLPVVLEEASWSEASVEEAPEFAPGGVALLVEDNPAVAAFTEALLTDLGFDVVMASNGEEGLGLLSEVRPRIVICDIVMPVMDGLEFARRLGAAHPEIPLVLASGYSHASVDTALAFLHKPSSRTDLLQALNSALAPLRKA
jgi:signal transduction histidine kinase/CheY-like chemotaxis protein